MPYWLRSDNMKPPGQRSFHNTPGQRSFQNTPGPRRNTSNSTYRETPRPGRDPHQFVFEDHYLGEEVLEEQTPRREYDHYQGAIPKTGPRFNRTFPRNVQPGLDRTFPRNDQHGFDRTFPRNEHHGFDRTFPRNGAEAGPNDPNAEADEGPEEEQPPQREESGMEPELGPNGGDGEYGPNEPNEDSEGDRSADDQAEREDVSRGMETPRGHNDVQADEGDLLMILGWVVYYIQIFLSSQNLLLAFIVIGLTLSLTGTSVWLKYSHIYWSSPWMYNWTCVGGLVVCFLIYLNKFCLYFWNKNVFISLFKMVTYPVRSVRFRNRHLTSDPYRPAVLDETYVINRGNMSSQSHGNQSSAPRSQRSNNNFQSSPPSGGWNGGNPYTSTPAPPSSRSNSRRNQSRNNGSNFRPDSRYGNLGSENPHINIREDLNTSRNHNISHYNSLSPEDKTMIDTLSPLASTHNLALPVWNSNQEYEDFKGSFMSFVPTIPENLRLEALKRALSNRPNALRVIAEFNDSSKETFSGAILALDDEFNDLIEVIERIVDQIQVITTTRSQSPDEFVSQINEMHNLVTKLSRKDPQTRLTLAPLTKEWLKFLPDEIDRQVMKNVRKYGRSWITFENVYTLCLDFVRGWRNTRDLVEKRAEAKRAIHKKSQSFMANPQLSEPPYVASSDVASSHVATSSDNFEEKETVIYLTNKAGKQPCCFCRKESHPSAGCPEVGNLTTMQIYERFHDKSIMSDNLLKLRCYLCCEQGHGVHQCILITHNIVPGYQCQCKTRPVHNSRLCQFITFKAQQGAPPQRK